MEIEDSLCEMSPNNPFLDKFTVDFMEDDDNETVIDFDYYEDNEAMVDVNQIEKICADLSDDISLDQMNELTATTDDSETEPEITANSVDDLLMGSQLMKDKYRNDKQDSEGSGVHKKCKSDQQKEKQIRTTLQMELELERQQRIQFQKRLEEHMNYSLRKEFEDSKQIKNLKSELLKCKQQLKSLKRSLKNNVINNINIDLNSNESTQKSTEQSTEQSEELSAEKSNEKPIEKTNKSSDCNSVMKSEVSMILQLINLCINEEEFQLETTIFRLDEFTNSMIDSIRKSVSYVCPRCNLTFNCLEIYYHLYKFHTKEKPILCHKCKVYCTHLDYWTEHNQLFHSGLIESVSFVDIGKYNRKPERSAKIATKSSSNGSNSYKSLRANTVPKTNYRLRSRTQQMEPTSSFDTDSTDSERSDSPEVINLSDSPTPPQSLPIPTSLNFRPTLSKPTLAVRSIPNEFDCDFPDCDFKTTSKDKLDFHTNAHTNSKYKCPYCPYVGNILNDIIRHIQKSKKHDGLKIYECRQCSYGSNCLSSFKQHLIDKHFDDSDDEEITDYITDLFRNEHSTQDKNKTRS